MTLQIRPMQQEDVETCGRICHAAFGDIARRHNFRPDFTDDEPAIQLMQALCESPQMFSVVAEDDGKVIGSNHLCEYDAIRAVGPITVDPNAQAKGAGRMLMEAVIERGKQSINEKQAAGIRLVQDAFNATSLSLYTSLGFDIREPLALIEGELHGDVPPDVTVRTIREDDYESCAELCRVVHGFDRLNELKHTPPFVTSFVAVRDGRITAYASAPQVWTMNHAVAETKSDMEALLTGAANLLEGHAVSFLLPMRQSPLFRWCLRKGLRVVKPLTLMSMGEYHEPRSCYLPSVGY
ncbi:MAG TPA: GNAT family N-acetyltransferase [Pyrinomonadaceae bacterium]|nr:GNAT family N-acetyltransferase [Pyrinomonadaceae bacterium]